MGDRVGVAYALTSLGFVYWRPDRYEQAIDHHQQALTFYREIAYRAGEAEASDSLGLVYWRQGRYGQAINPHQAGSHHLPRHRAGPTTDLWLLDIPWARWTGHGQRRNRRFAPGGHSFAAAA